MQYCIVLSVLYSTVRYCTVCIVLYCTALCCLHGIQFDNSPAVATSNTNFGSRRSQSFDLDSVDITTPLRADEVFTVQKHREVPVVLSASGAVTQAEEGDKKKKSTKKGKDNIDKPVKREKSSSRKSKSEPAGDLLMMEWNDPPISIPSPMVSLHATTAPSQSEVLKMDKEKGKHVSSKSSKHIWLPLLSDRAIDIFYATSTASSIVTVSLKAVNNSRTGSSVSVTATFKSCTAVRPATPSNSNLKVAQQLAPGDSCSAATDLVLLDGHSQQNPCNLQIGCTVHVAVDSLLGSDARSSPAVVKVPVCAMFVPNKLDEAAFTSLMGKHSSRWASSTVKILLSTKPKSAFKVIGNFLHAHTVEKESSTAVSLSSKSSCGGVVCCLAKLSKSADKLVIDVKCLCSSQALSQSLVEAVVEAVSDLSL